MTQPQPVERLDRSVQVNACERCSGPLVIEDLDELACLVCGARVYATSPLPFVDSRTGRLP